VCRSLNDNSATFFVLHGCFCAALLLRGLIAAFTFGDLIGLSIEFMYLSIFLNIKFFSSILPRAFLVGLLDLLINADSCLVENGDIKFGRFPKTFLCFSYH